MNGPFAELHCGRSLVKRDNLTRLNIIRHNYNIIAYMSITFIKKTDILGKLVPLFSSIHLELHYEIPKTIEAQEI
jgi:hypothetical protein